MAAWLFIASLMVTFRPCALNRPRCCAMNRPAESIAGNASTTMFVFSSGPVAGTGVPEHPARAEIATVAAIEVPHALRNLILTPCRGCVLLAAYISVSYTHLRAHETRHDLVCRLLLEKK